MSELKLSDFKMFESVPYELPPPGALTDLIMIGVKEVEKTYGSAFIIRFIKYALQFEAEKLSEEPPENIETIDQLKEYLISKSDKYPTPYCAILYAQFKAEKDFQGRIGAGTRVGTIGAVRGISENLGAEQRNVDVDAILSKINQFQTEMAIRPHEWGYKKNEDGSVDLLWPKCHFIDACQPACDEGLFKQPEERFKCASTIAISFYLKLFSGYEWDYELLKFDKTHCVAKCYMF